MCRAADQKPLLSKHGGLRGPKCYIRVIINLTKDAIGGELFLSLPIYISSVVIVTFVQKYQHAHNWYAIHLVIVASTYMIVH